MAVLNPPQFLPNVSHLIYRYLHRHTGDGVTIEELGKVLAPFGSTDDTVLSVVASVRGLAELGLLASEGGRYSVAPTAVADDSQDWDSVPGFRSLVRRFAFDSQANALLWEEGRHGPSQTGARDLVRATAWFLSLDVYSFSGKYDGAGGIHDLGAAAFGDHNPIVNPDRWQSFVRWETFLGFATPVHAKSLLLFPDPSVAILDTIATWDDLGKSFSLGEFVSRLAEDLPVLDGGRYRLAVQGKSKEPIPPKGTLSTALSHAILRLQDRKAIRLQSRADAPRLLLAHGRGDLQPHSHVTLVPDGG